MTNDEQLKQLRRWQECGYVHPLTCRGGGGQCSGDAINLEPVEIDGRVVLRCPGCKRIQEWIPPVCLTADLAAMNQFIDQLRSQADPPP